MMLVGPMGAFVLFFGWWIGRRFSTPLLRNLIRGCTTVIVFMCVTMVALSVPATTFEVPISHAPIQTRDF
jgi:hypothetical protein